MIDAGYSFINSLAEDNDLDFVFAHKDQVCNSMKKQRPHDPSAPYDGYDERDDTEDGRYRS